MSEGDGEDARPYYTLLSHGQTILLKVKLVSMWMSKLSRRCVLAAPVKKPRPYVYARTDWHKVAKTCRAFHHSKLQ